MRDGIVVVASEAQNAWVVRVLGVAMRPPSRPKPAPRTPVLPLWRDAKEALDSRFAQLSARMAACGHPLGARVADMGLPALTGRLLVPLMAACMDADAANGSDTPRRKALQTVTAVRRALLSNRRIADLDANPFDIELGLRTDVVGALDRIAELLAAEP